MNRIKALLFFFCFSCVSILVLKIQTKTELSNEPGWQEQYKVMKNLEAGVNYYGIRNGWARQDVLNKKNSDALSFITEMGPGNVGGRVRALLIDWADSAHIFAGGISGGLWVTNNGGKTWSAVDDQGISMAVSCITQNPFNPDEIYYGTGEVIGNTANIDGAGIFKSTDGGKTFKQLPSTASLSGFNSIWDIEFSKTDSSTLYVGLADGGLYRSRDNGLSFKKAYQHTGAGVHEIVTYEDSTIWFGAEWYGLMAASEGDVMKFKLLNNGLPWAGSIIGRISFNYCKKFPNVAYCQMLDPNGIMLVGIYKTSNHGLSWKKMTSLPHNFYSQGLYCLTTCVSPVDSNFVVVGSVKGAFSINSGGFWHELPASHADFHTNAFFPSGSSFLMGNDGGVYRFNTKTILTSPAVSLNNGLNITQFYTGNYHPFDSLKFIGGTQDNGTHFFNDSNFVNVYGGDGGYCAFSSTSPFYNYVSSQRGEIRRFTKNFSDYLYIKPFGDYTFWFINPFEVNPLDGNQVYFLTRYQMLVSNNSGINWTNLTGTLKTILSLGMSYEKDPTLYFGGPESVLYRSGRAASAVKQEVDLSSSSPEQARGSVINCIKVNKINPGTLYLSMSDVSSKPRVWKLNNAKSNNPSWTNISGNLPSFLPVNCLEINPNDSNTMVAGTDFGVYTTSDGGANWSKESAIPNAPVFKIVANPQTGIIYIFTHGRGVFRSKFNTKAGNNNPNNTRKITFNNPVETFLNLSIPERNEPANARVQLYNSIGQLAYEAKVSYKSSLDISSLSKGIYIMRLTMGMATFDSKILKL